jgi:prepilin-type N-terminal cleavage/methylation domain-containing protein
LEKLTRNYKTITNCQKGISLVEVLATVALVSIVFLLASSVHIFGQKQTVAQSKEIQSQSDDRLAVKIILKEIRMAQSVEVIKQNELTLNGIDLYKLEGSSLKKNNEILFPNITKFSVTLNGNQLKLTLGNTPETIIYLRE